MVYADRVYTVHMVYTINMVYTARHGFHAHMVYAVDMVNTVDMWTRKDEGADRNTCEGTTLDKLLERKRQVF